MFSAACSRGTTLAAVVDCSVRGCRSRAERVAQPVPRRAGAWIIRDLPGKSSNDVKCRNARTLDTHRGAGVAATTRDYAIATLALRAPHEAIHTRVICVPKALHSTLRSRGFLRSPCTWPSPGPPCETAAPRPVCSPSPAPPVDDVRQQRNHLNGGRPPGEGRPPLSEVSP